MIYALSALVTILIGILGYFGKKMDRHLESIAASVNEIKVEIGVLSNDHTNLKEDVLEIKQRVLKLERA